MLVFVNMKQNVYMYIFTNCTIANITEDQMRTIAQSLERTVVPKGTVIVEQDVLGDCCIILQSGTAEATVRMVERFSL